MRSWLARLLAPLRRLGRRLKDALRAILRRRRGPLAALAAMPALRWLARRLPTPLRLLLRAFAGVIGGKRAFGPTWMVVTVGIALGIAALVAVLLLPVAGLIALIVLGISRLVRRVRRRRSPTSGRGLVPDGVPDLVADAV
jgi:hypothetical protein